MRTSRKLRLWARDCIPVAIHDFCRPYLGSSVYYKDVYADWGAADAYATGYDAGLILDKVKQSVLKVKAGEAVYERDSVLFDTIQHSFPVLAALLRAAVENANRLSVLDFGGSLGSSYFQCRDFLAVLDTVQWGVVEQPHFVQCGQEYFEGERLRFFENITTCAAQTQPNVALLSGVLQYVSEPFAVLNELMQRGLPYIVIDRTPFSQLPDDHVTVQHVPPHIYSASYPCWIFSQSKFLAYTSDCYDTIATFESADGQAKAGGVRFTFGGMILRRRD